MTHAPPPLTMPFVPLTPLDVLPLEYASSSTVGLDPAARRRLHGYATRAVWLAVLSGLCVGVCFIDMLGAREHGVADWAVVLHTLVFVATIMLGVRTGGALRRTYAAVGGTPQRLRQMGWLDALALFGLILIALAPAAVNLAGKTDSKTVAALLAAGFWCLTFSVPRHVMLYRSLAELSRHITLRPPATGFAALGMTKAIYEGVWLFCCAFPLTAFAIAGNSADWAFLFAFGALFGCIGFIGLWVWMIVSHSVFQRYVGAAPGMA